MSLAQLLLVLKGRWKPALIVWFVIVALTLTISLVLPKQYLATSTVVVDIKPDPLAGFLMGQQIPAYVATQIDIIQSERVALRVVRNLKLAESPEIRQQWLDETKGKGSIENWLSELFQKFLIVKPGRDSTVIAVSYKNQSAQFASAMANAFVQAYLETTVEMRVDPARQYTSFFDSRAKEAREALDKAQTKLSEFQRENGIIASDERLDIETSRLNELSSQYVSLQALASESSSRNAQANQSAERMPEVINNGLVAALKADISRAEARLQELNSRYGENHPNVIETRASLSELRTRLDAEIKRVTGSVGVTNTVTRAREADVRASLEAQRAKVLKLKTVRDEGTLLQRDVENAQRAFEQTMQRFSQTNMESQTTQSNVYVLTQATPPVQPDSPRVTLNTVIAFFVGLVIAVIVALVMEMLDRRLRAPEDVVHALGLPVIGMIPAPGMQILGRRLATPLLEQRLLGQLSSPAAKEA